MSQAPGQNLVPLEAFQVGTEQSAASFRVVAYQSDSDFQVQWNNRSDHFGSPAEAHARMQELRAAFRPLRITEIHLGQPPSPKSKTTSASAHSSQHPKTETHPAHRALQQTPPKTPASGAGPHPGRGPEPGRVERSVAANASKAPAQAGTKAGSPSAPRGPADRAKSTHFKPRPERPLALMSDAAAEYVVADTIGSVPFLVGAAALGSLNPLVVPAGLYAAYKLSEKLTPIQQAIDEDAAERLHRAEGTAPDWFVTGGTFAMTFLPQLLGGPEEDGALAAKEAGTLAGTAARYALKEGEVSISRFRASGMDAASAAAQRARLLASQFGFCFAEGTLVCTPSGSVSIETLQPGSPVLAWDRKTRRSETGYVRRVFRNYSPSFIRLRMDGEVILTTPRHPFWVPGRGWLPAEFLRVGDSLFSGAHGPCILAEADPVPEPAETFNLEVSGFHNYFVSTAGVLVHNTSTIGKGLNSMAAHAATVAIPGPRVLVGLKSTARNSGQRAVMGRSASEVAGTAGYVWFHKIALTLSGPQARANLVAASGGANRTMIPFEMALASAARKGQKAEIQVTTHVFAGTDVASHFEVNAWINNQQVLETTLAADVLSPVSEEMSFWMRGMDMSVFKK